MTKAFNTDLQRRLESFIAEAGSQEKAASLIGYSAATLSTYRKGTYNGDVDKLENRLRELFVIEKAAEGLHSSLLEYVPTSISQKVYETIRICHLKGGLAIECGDAGIGKTKAAEKYVADYPNSAIYITVNPCFTSLSSFLKLLCKRLRISTGRKDDMWLDIDSYLRGWRKVLIVDEAQHLTARTLDHLRCISDESGVGIAFIGNEEVYKRLYGSGRAEFAQLFSRIGMRKQVLANRLTQEDITSVFGSYGLEKGAIELLTAISRTNYGLRGAVNVFINAAAVFGAVDKGGIVRVMKDMDIG